MAGGFAVLKDVAKTLVYELSRWRNTVSEVIPERIITRAPSAELRPDQKTRTACRNTRCWTPSCSAMSSKTARRMRSSPKASRADVRKVVRLLKINEYKRRQAPVGRASPSAPLAATGATRSPTVSADAPRRRAELSGRRRPNRHDFCGFTMTRFLLADFVAVRGAGPGRRHRPAQTVCARHPRAVGAFSNRQRRQALHVSGTLELQRQGAFAGPMTRLMSS